MLIYIMIEIIKIILKYAQYNTVCSSLLLHMIKHFFTIICNKITKSLMFILSVEKKTGQADYRFTIREWYDRRYNCNILL